MENSRAKPVFFNRPHVIEGTQILAMVLSMLGVTFAGLDWLSKGHIRLTTLAWTLAALVFSVFATVLARRLKAGIAPLAAGALVGSLYLGMIWLSAS